jgi:hypothetical protein
MTTRTELTRTELIQRLRDDTSRHADGDKRLCNSAADMLEADAQTDDMVLSAARESAARAIAECDKLQAAARLALDALLKVLVSINDDKMPFDGDSFHEAVAALTEALK